MSEQTGYGARPKTIKYAPVIADAIIELTGKIPGSEFTVKDIHERVPFLSNEAISEYLYGYSTSSTSIKKTEAVRKLVPFYRIPNTTKPVVLAYGTQKSAGQHAKNSTGSGTNQTGEKQPVGNDKKQTGEKAGDGEIDKLIELLQKQIAGMCGDMADTGASIKPGHGSGIGSVRGNISVVLPGDALGKMREKQRQSAADNKTEAEYLATLCNQVHLLNDQINEMLSIQRKTLALFENLSKKGK